MSIKKSAFILLLLLPFLFACNRNPLKVDISNCKKDIQIVRFNNELFSADTTNLLNDLVELSNNHPDFFNLFTYKMIRVGGLGDEEFSALMLQFLTDTMIVNVQNLVKKEFADFDKIGDEINTAFKYFQYYFPDKQLPVIYTAVTGFNQSVVTAENIVGISLDKYLGIDCEYYKKLNTTPLYKIKNMHKKKLVSDVVYAWGITEFNENDKTTNLLSNIIHQGKLMYFEDALLPEMNDTLKIGYSAKQLKWCRENEAQMWMYLVEKKLLYSNKRMDIIRYINDGPTTNGFPLASPSRTGIWLGWQIVRQYMKKNPEITLPELMKNTDYQGILNDSAYFPE